MSEKFKDIWEHDVTDAKNGTIYMFNDTIALRITSMKEGTDIKAFSDKVARLPELEEQIKELEVKLGRAEACLSEQLKQCKGDIDCLLILCDTEDRLKKAEGLLKEATSYLKVEQEATEKACEILGIDKNSLPNEILQTLKQLKEGE